MLQRSTLLPVLVTALLVAIPERNGLRAQGIVRDDTPGAGRNEPVLGTSTGADGPVEYVIGSDLGQLGSGDRTLFHSFREFNLTARDIATFEGPTSVENIIARVTGGSRSSIDGTIRSDIQGANLFFLNPAGVLFGPNATLELTGSFFASTAQQLRFEDGAIFEARAAGNVPLLSVADPDQFGFLGAAGSIEVRGSLLSVFNGTLGLIGGDVTLSGEPLEGGGVLNAELYAGDKLAVDIPEAERIGNVRLSAGRSLSLTDTRVETFGRGIDLMGGDIRVMDSELWTFSASSLPLEAAQISLLGGDISAERSFIMTGLFGSGGPLVVKGDEVRLERMSMDAGMLSIDARDLLVRGSPLRPEPGESGCDQLRCFDLYDSTFAAADIFLRADEMRFDSALLLGLRMRFEGGRLQLENETRIQSLEEFIVAPSAPLFVEMDTTESVTLTSGAGIFLRAPTFFEDSERSRVQIKTSDLLIEDNSTIATGALISSVFNPSPGNPNARPAGVVRIDADRVRLRSGGQIDSSSLSFSDGGLIDITATELIEISDPESGIFSVAALDGRAGEIRLSAPQFVIRNGGRISTESTLDPRIVGRPFDIGAQQPSDLRFGTGNAGQILIEGDSILVESGGAITSSTAGSGDGGLIRLLANDSLTIRSGGSVTANSTGSGRAGSIELRSKGNLRLQDALVSTSSLGSAGGDISISGRVVDIERSTVSTNVGAGSGGNIEIDADVLLLRSESEIVARAKEGTGGNIRIRASAFLRGPSTRVDASADLGIDGSVEISSPAVDLNASLAVLGRAYVDPADLLTERCDLREQEGVGSFKLGGRGAMPEAPERGLAARHSRLPAQLGPADRGDFDTFLRETADAQAAPSVEQTIRAAEVLEALGELDRARELLDAALERADRPQRASMLALRARLWTRSRSWANAERDFAAAQRAAEEVGTGALLARVLLDRGHAEAEQGRAEAARRLYARAAASAQAAGDADVLARSRAAAASSEAERSAALDALLLLAPTHDRLFASLSAGLALAALPGDGARIRAGEAFARIAEQSQELGDAAAASYAWGSLADLYAREERTGEATELMRRALEAAARADRAESVYRWAGRLGGALRAAGDLEGAARAYEIALQAAERVRGGAALSARAQREFAAAFPIRPLSLELVDVQLQRAARAEPAEARSALLFAARARLEASSRREIRDYFQDECLALERPMPLDQLPDALVVYPVLLPDRAEVLVSSVQGIRRMAVPASPAEIRREMQALRDLVVDRSTHEYRRPASRLFEWLIEPLLADAGAGRTLVIVPGAEFAEVPFAALFDKKRGTFLIEQYPVAVSPGLSLIEPHALPPGERKVLQAGLTQAVENFPALASAQTEIDELQRVMGGKVLLDAQFSAAALDAELRSTPYEIVHIASHGQFGGDAESTYLLTFDGRIGMAELADLVSRTRFRETPLELLTLSACQTAVGDERAALGLAGIAVRSGARSTLATLWSVNDPATARLMGAFYRALVEKGGSRAGALQRAQRALIADPVYRHPAYWSPFVLVGSWR